MQVLYLQTLCILASIKTERGMFKYSVSKLYMKVIKVEMHGNYF